MIRNTHTVDVTIASGASLSGAVDLEGFAVVAIEMPAAWTAAGITFQAASLSGGTYLDVYDDAGAEVAISAGASRVIAVTGADADALAPLQFIKIRSGTGGVPVAQAAERKLRLICKSSAF